MLAPVRTTSSMPATTTTGSATDGASASNATTGTASSAATTANSTSTTGGSTTAASSTTPSTATNTTAGTTVGTTSNATSAESAPASPLSGGRYGLLSLSGQLQMAQGVSAIADAIGQALQMPRGDSEGLQDYAARLATAVSAMSTAERQDLEATINQSVSGTSLRMLADLLRSPAGPDAARLTAYLEAALTDGADPDQVMRAVLSAYQQDAEPDALSPRTALPGATSLATAAQASIPASTAATGSAAAGPAAQGATTIAMQGDGPDGQPGAPTASTGAGPGTGAGTSAADGRQAAQITQGSQAGPGTQGGAATPGSQTAGSTLPNANAPGTGPGTSPGATTNGGGPEPAQPASATAASALADKGADGSLLGHADRPAATATPGAASGPQANAGVNAQTFLSGLAAQIRNLGQSLTGTPSPSPAAGQISGDLTAAPDQDFPDMAVTGRAPVSTGLSQVIASRPDTLATIEWLATALAGNTLPGLIAALAAHGRGSMVDDFIARLIAGGLAMGSSDTGQLMAQAKAMAAPADPQTTGSIADDADLPQMLAQARQHASTSGREDIDGLPLPLSPQMQAAQAREGFVFPYVTYPPLDQPPQRRPRRPTIEISAVDEDGEHPQQPGEQAFDDDDDQDADQANGGAEDGGDTSANAGAESGPLTADGKTDGPKAERSDTASAGQSQPETSRSPGPSPSPSAAAAGKRAAPTAHLAHGADQDDDLPHDLYFKMAGWK